MDRCLRCEYELKGLSEECTCPECGLGHDPHAFSFHFVRESRFVLYVIIFTTLNAYIVLITQKQSLQWEHSLLMIMAVLGTVTIFNYLFSLSDRRSLMVINKGGIHFYFPGRDDHTIRWCEISNIDQSWFTARMRIYNPDGKKYTPHPITDSKAPNISANVSPTFSE